MKTRHAFIKAWGVSIFLAVVAFFSLIFVSSDVPIVWPALIFFIVLLFNTFFSIELFASVTPRNSFAQHAVDIVLLALYIFLAVNLKVPVRFVFLSLLIFIFATMKYALLLGTIEHPKLLKRKILVDIVGTLACSLTLGGVMFADPLTSLWVLTITFTIANIILFTVWPLYRFHDISL